MNSAMTWSDAYIGLGSNLDNPLQHILKAVDDIAATEGIARITLSDLYGSRPVGPQDQPDYVNAVMHIKTHLSPTDLLYRLQHIENHHGRERKEHWGARTLDLDILLFGDQIITSAELAVPHPEMTKRAFVLYPLADVAPDDLTIPGNGRLSDLLLRCSADGIHRLPS
jgi:2-amino-4-hydroxy-6-hydroxymethyldihydropteridine diphosphokinase